MSANIPRIYCRACAYPLDSKSAGACPECGLSFDPGSRATYNSEPLTWGQTQWVRHVINVTAIICWFCTAILHCYHGRFTTMATCIMSIWIFPCACWIGYLVHILNHRRNLPVTKKLIFDQALLPIMVIFLAVAIAFGWPQYVVFVGSQKSLDQMVLTLDEELELGEVKIMDEWVGFYKITEVQSTQSGFFIRVDTSERFHDDFGLLYYDQERVEHNYLIDYEHLGLLRLSEKWYLWRKQPYFND